MLNAFDSGLLDRGEIRNGFCDRCMALQIRAFMSALKSALRIAIAERMLKYSSQHYQGIQYFFIFHKNKGFYRRVVSFYVFIMKTWSNISTNARRRSLINRPTISDNVFKYLTYHVWLFIQRVRNGIYFVRLFELKKWLYIRKFPVTAL